MIAVIFIFGLVLCMVLAGTTILEFRRMDRANRKQEES